MQDYLSSLSLTLLKRLQDFNPTVVLYPALAESHIEAGWKYNSNCFYNQDGRLVSLMSSADLVELNLFQERHLTAAGKTLFQSSCR